MYTAIKAEAQRAALECDADYPATFFARAYNRDRICLVALDPFETEPPIVKVVSSHESRKITAWIAAHIASRNLYYTINPVRRSFKGINGPPQKDDIERVLYFQVDLDSHKGESSEKGIARCWQQLGSLPYKPTISYVTGNGVQALFKVSDVCFLEDAQDRELAEATSATLRDILCGDDVHNVNRIFRIPGTVNTPTRTKRADNRAVSFAGKAKFSSSTLGYFEFEHSEIAKAVAVDTAYEPEECDLNDPRISWRVRAIIVDGRLQEAKDGDDSRSVWEYDAACWLIRAGLSDGEILYLLTNNAYAISEKSADRYDQLAYMRRVIANARRDVGLVDAVNDFNSPLDAEWADGYDAQPAKQPGERHRFKGWTLDELAEMPPPVYLVDGILYAGGTALFFGKQKSGKTYFVGTMGLCIATGTPFAGLDVEQGRVLHILAEGNAALFGQRVEAWIKYTANGSKEAEARLRRLINKNWRVVSSAVHIADPKQAALLLEQNPGQWAMIIVDTVFRNASGDINNQQDAQLFIDGGDYLARQTGAAVVLVHHVGKDPAKGAFGSTALPAAVDLSGLVTLAGHKRSFKVTEARNGFDPRPINFDLVQVELDSDANGRPQSSAAVRFHDRSEPDEPVSLEEDILRFILDEKPKTQTVIASNFKMNKQRISEKIKELREDGFITNDGLQLTPAGLEYIREPDDGFG